MDRGPAYYLDIEDEDVCDRGTPLYLPNGEPVCPDDPRYAALARALAAVSGDGDVSVGDLGCADVDVAAWKRENLVRLYPGQRHRWLLAISTAPSSSGLLGANLSTMTEEQLRTNIAGGVTNGSIFGKWFEKVNGVPFSGDIIGTAGEIDNVRTLAFGSREAMIAVAQKSGLVPAQRAEDTKRPTVTVPAPKVYALVEFVYRSVMDTMPWPVYNDLTLAPKWCPVDAQVALSVAFEQSSDAKVVPKETSLFNPSTVIPGVPSSEEISKAATALGAGMGEAAKDIGKGLVTVLFGVAAIAGVVLIAKNR